MLTTYEAREQSVRALACAVVFGSTLGLLIGGAYVGGQGARQALYRSSRGPQAHLSARAVEPDLRTRHFVPPIGLTSQHLDPPTVAEPVPGLNVAASPPSPQRAFAAALRDRFRLALAITRSVARPFHFSDAADHGGDEHCLAQAVYYEARGESPSGQAAVAQVVLNRVRHPAFPKTVCGVVYQRSVQGCQFSFACNGALHAALEPGAWRRAQSVAERALGGAVMADVGEATQFQAYRAGAGWASGLSRVAQIGEHVFYRLAGRAGSAAMFHQRPQASPASSSDDAPRATSVASLDVFSRAPSLIQAAQQVQPLSGAALAPPPVVLDPPSKAASAHASPVSAAAESSPATPEDLASKPTTIAGL